MAVRMELSQVLIRESNDTHVVVLREAGGERTFPILIGMYEAMAIERRLMGQKPPRPQTHELMANVIDALGGTLEKVVVTELKDHIFFARLYIRRDGELLDIDSRPSDAIALGVATSVPIYVAEHILDEVC